MIVAPKLKSERLKFRDIKEEDASIIVKWRSNPDVYKYFLSPHKINTEEHLNWFNTRYIFDENMFDWIAFNEERQPVGIFGIKRLNVQSQEAEVSYILDPEFYGVGYASEAVLRIIQFCQENWNIKIVYAEIHVENENSRRFAEKLGFTILEIHGLFVRYGRAL